MVEDDDSIEVAKIFIDSHEVNNNKWFSRYFPKKPVYAENFFYPEEPSKMVMLIQSIK